jgi:chemotaxis protein CheX
MDQQLISSMRKAFADSTVFAFSRMIVVDLTADDSKPAGPHDFDVSAVIGFSGDVAGSCALRMSNDTAREAVSRLAGEPVDDAAEIADGIGELANMIAGNAKAALEPRALSLSFPEVIRGKGHEIGFHRYADLFELHFMSEIGKVAVIVAYTNPKETNGR